MTPLEETKQAVKYLKAARKLITPEGSWCKGSLAKTSKGRTIGPDCDAAVSFCVLGAVSRVLGGSTIGIGRICDNALQFSFGDYYVDEINDKRSTKHLHVLMAYDFAILHAEDEVKRLRKLEKAL